MLGFGNDTLLVTMIFRVMSVGVGVDNQALNHRK